MKKLCSYSVSALFVLGLILITGCNQSRVPTASEGIPSEVTKTLFSSSGTGCISPPSGLVSWWPGDGDARDIQGGRDGTLVNEATFAPGMVGQAFSFDGVNDFVSVPDDPIWTLGDNPFTIDLWVNFNQVKGRDPFIGHDEAGGQFNKWIFWHDASGHRGPRGPALRFHINSPTLPPLDPVVALWRPIVGRWYHVAVTRSSNTYILYIDGAQVGIGIDPNTIPDPNFPLTIGRAESFFFNGLIDEVEIFNRALSSSEIQAIFNAGSAGKCKFISVDLDIDIKPQSCPNPLNTKSKGVLPVAVLGTASFDVNDIDVATVKLEGVSPLRSDVEDVAAPVANRQDDCDCTTDGPDGFDDLTLKFDTQDIVLALGAVSDGQEVKLTLTGNLNDGTPITGLDCVVIKKK